MKIKILQTQSNTRTRKAYFGFTLVETLAATTTAAIWLSAHFLAFASGFALMTVTREDVRATQIMLQRMEAVRLSGYNQFADTNKYPPSVTQDYDEKGKTNGTGGGVAYNVTHQIASALGSLPPSYRCNLTQVTVGVSWTSGKANRSHNISTYVAQCRE